jgi:predicted unusual protein kinase regulating ubiquinone biosynthesis (AarF/ABC1/UbiB family)
MPASNTQLLNTNFPRHYDVELVKRLFSPALLKHPATLLLVLSRFATIVWVLLKVMWYAWHDGKLANFKKAPDPKVAQKASRIVHAQWLCQQILRFGPTFIKVGQSLSTRVDLIRKELVDALATLQDRVPPFDVGLLRQTIVDELGAEPETLFATFDNTPLAAASLGQVHRATLADGQEIVVKVQRPDLLRSFYLDLAILRRIAWVFEHYTELGRGREWVAVVDTFGKTLFEEIDYRQEAKNGDKFYTLLHNTQPEPGVRVHIPKMLHQYITGKVLVMEYAPGLKINDNAVLAKAGVNHRSLGLAVVKLYFQQLLVHGLYHADPHPGNMAVRPLDGALIIYDFGMVGVIDTPMRLAMVDTFLNLVDKKPAKILNNLLQLDMIAPNADLDIMQQVIEWSLDNYYDVPREQLNFDQLTKNIAELMYSHPFKLPPDFTLIIRAMLTLEGIASGLYPDIRFMQVAIDYAQGFLRKTLSVQYFVRKGLEKSLDWLGVGSSSLQGGGRAGKTRLHPDEWFPIGRYLKLGLSLLWVGQSLGLLLVLALGASLLPAQAWGHVRLSQWVVIGVVIACWLGLGVLGLVLLLRLPSRKKAMFFNPKDVRQ